MIRTLTLCVIAACVPPNGTWSAQPGARLGPPHPAPDDDDDPEEEPTANRSGGSWLCSARATLQESSDGGSWEDSPISSVGGGDTRDDASYKAVSSCNSLVTLELTRMQIAEWRVVTESECHITECNGS